MNVSTHLRRLCIAACAVAALAAWADPPGRVGRITYIEGAVSFYGDRDEGWRKAQINYPVTTENSLWTEGNARAEIRIGPSAIRVNDDSILDFVTLQDDTALGFLQRGSVSVRLRQFGTLEAADILQIDTSEGRFTLEGNGRYRLDAVANGNESRISVFSGRARFDRANSSDPQQTIEAGKQLTVRLGGPATDFRYDRVLETAFDRWAEGRDQQWEPTHQRYTRDNTPENLISPYMTGYEDLDANGDWINDNEYGRLWTPRVVVAGWAPYRYGRWVHVRPWGWTWIDDAPWGFAPFHYGRWVQVRSRWSWWPGPYIGRPVYAPALVAWFGGPGIGLTISSGPAVGWFPLAPREYYIPRYTTNPHYLRRVNYVTNNITIINPPTRYRNQVPGATIVANNVFVNGHPVGNRTAHLPPHVISGHAPIASLDIPRPPRNNPTQMPDRRQESRSANPAPRPHFANEPPPSPVAGPVRPPPAAQTPKYRAAEPGTSGPLPARKATPEPIQPGALPATATGAMPPAAPPRTRPLPVASPPPSGTTTVQGPVRVDTAPVVRDREVRPDVRSPGARGSARPQPDGQNQPAPKNAAPVVTPLQPPPQPAVKAAEPAKATPVPGRAAKPHQDVPAEAGQNKDKPAKPGVAKE